MGTIVIIVEIENSNLKQAMAVEIENYLEYLMKR